MWQSQVEIEHYSVAYFDCITTFKVLKRSTSLKGGAYTRYVDLSGIDAASLHIWAPPITEVLYYSASSRNMQQNNVRFLPGTATYTLFSSWIAHLVCCPPAQHVWMHYPTQVSWLSSLDPQPQILAAAWEQSRNGLSSRKFITQTLWLICASRHQSLSESLLHL